MESNKEIKLEEQDFELLYDIGKRIQENNEKINRLRQELNNLEYMRVYLNGQKDIILKILGQKYGFDPNNQFLLDEKTKTIKILEG